MIANDMVYTFLMDDKCYCLKQNWHFGEDERSEDETAVEFLGCPSKDVNKDAYKVISRLTFHDLCDLKEVVDEVFENLLPRYKAQPDYVRFLLEDYPWLKEKADINPLFGNLELPPVDPGPDDGGSPDDEPEPEDGEKDTENDNVV